MNKTDTTETIRTPLFQPLREEERQIRVEVDGEIVMAGSRDTVASLLLGLKAPDQYRHAAVTGAARAPLCMMGVCFECLVEIDGQRNQQGCLVRVREGMRIVRQLSGGSHP